MSLNLQNIWRVIYLPNFTYEIPITMEEFFRGILIQLEVEGHTHLVNLLRGGSCSIENSGTYSAYFGSGRSDAMGVHVKLYVNPNNIETLNTEDNKEIIINICDDLIPAEVGFDVKSVRFITDINGDYDLDRNLINDLNSQSDILSEEIINTLLPDEIKEKGFYMAEIYIYLYSVENSLRLFIEKVAKDNYGEEYFEEISTSSIESKFQRRKEKEREHKWLSIRGDSELFYLDFKDLKKIIQANWDIFNDYFPNQNFIVAKIDEIAECRNLVAHNSLVEESDKDLVKTYYNSILSQIDKTL